MHTQVFTLSYQIHFLLLSKPPKIANFTEFLKRWFNPSLKLFQFLKDLKELQGEIKWNFCTCWNRLTKQILKMTNIGMGGAKKCALWQVFQIKWTNPADLML